MLVFFVYTHLRVIPFKPKNNYYTMNPNLNSHLSNSLNHTELTEPMLGTQENLCPDGITSISVLIRNLSREVSFIRAQIASVKEELGTITQTVKSHLPGPAAVDKALKISEQEVRDAAAALNDRQARANRFIIWGHFTQKG